MATEIRKVSGLPAKGRLSHIKGLLTPGSARWLGVFLLFLIVAVVETWPLILHIDNSNMDSPRGPLPDIYNHIWHLRWVKQAFIDFQTNPLHTRYLFYPDGENLYLTPVMFVNGIMTLPLQIATDNIFLSWNIVGLLLFALSGLCTYALAHRLTGNHAASILAGFIFAFSPFVMMQFTTGRWSISTTWPMPLIALFLLRFLDNGRLREAIVVAALWLALLYNFQEYAMDAALFLGIFVLFWAVLYLKRGDRQRLESLVRGAVLIGVVWLVAGAPMLIGAIKDVRSGQYVLPHQAELFSADLLSFVTPSPLWGPGEDPNSVAIPPHDIVGSAENTLYLGGVPLLLATLALVTVSRKPLEVLLWGVVFVLFLVLTVGPYIYVDQEKVLGGIPMPYQIYDQLPIFGGRRLTPRMIPFALLGLSMLAALGFDSLTSWLRRIYRPLVPLAFVLLFSLVALEYWNPPVHLSHLPRPAILKQIRDEPGDFAVLDAPLGRRTGWSFNGSFEAANTADYYAALHGKHAFGGFEARVSEHNLAWLRKEPGLRYLAFPFEPPLADDLDPAAVKSVFSKYEIKYVILHKTGPHNDEVPSGQPVDSPERLDQMDRYIRGVVGFTVVESDPSMTVYRNPDFP